MTKLVDDELLDLFAGCPKLERLTLVNCTKLTHAPITRALQNCERLQSIDMTGVQDIQDDIINALAQNCTRLQGSLRSRLWKRVGKGYHWTFALPVRCSKE